MEVSIMRLTDSLTLDPPSMASLRDWNEMIDLGLSEIKTDKMAEYGEKQRLEKWVVMCKRAFTGFWVMAVNWGK